jgi:hypothetical protein
MPRLIRFASMRSRTSSSSGVNRLDIAISFLLKIFEKENADQDSRWALGYAAGLWQVPGNRLRVPWQKYISNRGVTARKKSCCMQIVWHDNKRMGQSIIQLDEILGVQLKCKSCEAALTVPLSKMTSDAAKRLGSCPVCSDPFPWATGADDQRNGFDLVVSEVVGSIQRLLGRGFTGALVVRTAATKESAKYGSQ